MKGRIWNVVVTIYWDMWLLWDGIACRWDVCRVTEWVCTGHLWSYVHKLAYRELSCSKLHLCMSNYIIGHLMMMTWVEKLWT